MVQTTGHKAFKCVYPHGGQNRWYHIAAVDAVGLADARKIANRVITQAADGKDPVAERKALRSRGTFGDLSHPVRRGARQAPQQVMEAG